MITDITDEAVEQLNILAGDNSYLKIEATTRGTSHFLWIIAATSGLDSDFYLKEIKGINLLVEKASAIFLTEAIIDYSESIAKNGYPGHPTHSHLVWPRGFVFKDLLYLTNTQSTSQ